MFLLPGILPPGRDNGRKGLGIEAAAMRQETRRKKFGIILSDPIDPLSCTISSRRRPLKNGQASVDAPVPVISSLWPVFWFFRICSPNLFDRIIIVLIQLINRFLDILPRLLPSAEQFAVNQGFDASRQ